MGDWLKVNGETVYATTAAPLTARVWGVNYAEGKQSICTYFKLAG